MGVNPDIPAPKPRDHLNYVPIRPDDNGEATRHNIRVEREKERLKQEQNQNKD